MGAKPRAVPADVTARATVTVCSAGGESPLYVDVPRDFARDVGTAARVAVQGELNRAAFDGAAIPLGGRLRIVIGRELAGRAGVYAGALAALCLRRVDEPA